MRRFLKSSSLKTIFKIKHGCDTRERKYAVYFGIFFWTLTLIVKIGRQHDCMWLKWVSISNDQLELIGFHFMMRNTLKVHRASSLSLFDYLWLAAWEWMWQLPIISFYCRPAARSIKLDFKLEPISIWMWVVWKEIMVLKYSKYFHIL